jgi:hypothetical protein
MEYLNEEYNQELCFWDGPLVVFKREEDATAFKLKFGI